MLSHLHFNYCDHWQGEPFAWQSLWQLINKSETLARPGLINQERARIEESIPSVGNNYADRRRAAQEALSPAEGLKRVKAEAGAGTGPRNAEAELQLAKPNKGLQQMAKGINGKSVTRVKSVKCKISLMIECSRMKQNLPGRFFFCAALSQSQ